MMDKREDLKGGYRERREGKGRPHAKHQVFYTTKVQAKKLDGVAP